MGGLYLALESVVDPGDEVLIPEPCWPNYVSQVMLTGATPIPVPMSPADGFTLTPDEVAAAVTGKTKALMLNSPSNPTGAVIPADRLLELAKLAREKDLVIISDEVYEKLVWTDAGHTSIASFPEGKERTVVVHSLSKSYAMTGWRVGYSVGPSEIVKLMVKLQENIYACASTVAQYAAMAAITRAGDEVQTMKDEYRARRSLALERIARLPNVSATEPEGSFYIFLDIRDTGLDSRSFAFDLLKQEGVAVVPGNAFGAAGEGFVRLSYATSREKIEAGFDRIEAFLTSRA
jgi:aminotransferase